MSNSEQILAESTIAVIYLHFMYIIVCFKCDVIAKVWFHFFSFLLS